MSLIERSPLFGSKPMKIRGTRFRIPNSIVSDDLLGELQIRNTGYRLNLSDDNGHEYVEAKLLIPGMEGYDPEDPLLERYLNLKKLARKISLDGWTLITGHVDHIRLYKPEIGLVTEIRRNAMDAQDILSHSQRVQQ